MFDLTGYFQHVCIKSLRDYQWDEHSFDPNMFKDVFQGLVTNISEVNLPQFKL